MKSSLPADLPLTREGLIQAIAEGFVPKWCFFWGHTPAKDGSVSKSCFSQWWEGHSFTVDHVLYRTAEHYMMAGKARLFLDQEILSRILACAHPAEAKKLGREVRNFDESAWQAACLDIVIQGNAAKFRQHPELRAFLLNTGSRILVEASPRDRIWGIGVGASNPAAENPAFWKGRNLLGFALMAVREMLRETETPPHENTANL